MTTLLLATALLNRHVQKDPLKNYDLTCGLSVSMPVTPVEEVDKKTGRRAYQAFWVDGLYYVSDCPAEPGSKETPDQQLREFVFGELGSIPSVKVRKYAPVSLDGWPGVEFSAEDVKDGTATWARCYSINNHYVEVGVVYDANGQSPLEGSAVLASLRQTQNPAYGPITSTDVGFADVEPADLPIKLDFPADVQPQTEEIGDSGEKITLHSYTFCRDMRMLDFTYLEVPGSENASSDEAAEIRSQTLQGFLNAFGAEKDSSSTEQRDGKDWLTSTFHIKNLGYGRADVLLYGGHVYSFMAVGPEPWQDSPEFHRFFDSIEVKN